eukprot:4009323-Pleurochrysis_carterae.AAC.1
MVWRLQTVTSERKLQLVEALSMQHRRQLGMHAAARCMMLSSLSPPLHWSPFKPNVQRAQVGVAPAGDEAVLGLRQALRQKCIGMRI